jgi:hypothetical protein
MENKEKFLLCAMCKLENHYLGEWITYHLNIGFDKIVLIDNNDTEGEFAENIYDVIEIKEGVENGNVDIVPLNNCKRLQQIQYMKVYEKYKYDYDWVCFLDIDEFLVLKNHTNINDFVNQDKFNDFNTIRLCWRCYGDNELIEVVDNNYNVRDRLVKESNKLDANMVKVIFRSFRDEEILIPNPHAVVAVSSKCCNSAGVKTTGNQLPKMSINTITYEDAYIAHYPTKTIQEYLDTKIKRGGSAQNQAALNAKYNLKYFFRYNNRSNDKINYIKNRGIDTSDIEYSGSGMYYDIPIVRHRPKL